MSLRSHIFRWMLAIGLLGSAIAMAAHGYRILEFLWFLPAFLLAAVGIGLILKDVIHLAAAPFVSLVESIVFPRVSGGKPAPNYKLAAYYVEEERFADAIEEYRTIIRNHPGEKDAYLQLLELLIDQGQRDEAEKLLARARRKLGQSSESGRELEALWTSPEGRAGAPGANDR